MMILFLILFLSLFLIFSTKKSFDQLLVENYQKKENYKRRVVLVIESFLNQSQLVTLLRNILKQDIKVDSIILVSKNEDLKKVPIVHNTCVFNKVGGLSLMLKETGNDTIIVFIFSDGCYAFFHPQFLKAYIEAEEVEEINTPGLIKVETRLFNVSVDKVYKK